MRTVNKYHTCNQCGTVTTLKCVKETIDAAVIEALEEAAKAICSYCNNDKNELKTSGNCVWWHTLQPPRTTTPMCKAWCIHQLIAARKAAQGEGA